MKKKKGSIIVEATVIYAIVLILILIAYGTAISIVKAEAEMTSDDVVSSELAVYRELDFDLLAKSDNLDLLVIKDKDKALATFKEYLIKNMNLKDNFEPNNEKYNFIKSTVRIESFIIYNVYNDGINVYSYSEKMNQKDKKIEGTWDADSEKKPLDTNIKTPKGNKVEHTTIYAKIGFTINPIFKSKNYVNIEEETDILKGQE